MRETIQPGQGLSSLSKPRMDPSTTQTTASMRMAKKHVIKLPLGSTKCQLRWEDLYNLKDTDYNDLIVRSSRLQNKDVQ